MAKSKNNAQPNKPQTGLALALQASTALGVDATLTKDDIIAVAVSREEMALKRQEIELLNDIRSLTKDNETLNEKVNAALKELANARQGQIDTIISNFAKLGCEVKAGIAAHVDGDKVDVSIVFNSHTGERNAGGMSFHVKAETPKAIVALKNEMKANSDQIADLKDKVVKIRAALNDLPTMERQARAAITEAALSSSAQGQALLDTLGGVKSLRSIN